MKIHFPIKSFADIEEFLSTITHRIPQPSSRIQPYIIKALPYIALAVGSLLISVAVVPLIGDFSHYDGLAKSGLYNFNIALFRITFVLMGIILITSFNLLSQKKLRGWYNLFYLTLFHTFFVIILLNIYSLIFLFVSWYILFAVRKEFS